MLSKAIKQKQYTKPEATSPISILQSTTALSNGQQMYKEEDGAQYFHVGSIQPPTPNYILALHGHTASGNLAFNK
jgi:hypothetical protein